MTAGPASCHWSHRYARSPPLRSPVTSLLFCMWRPSGLPTTSPRCGSTGTPAEPHRGPWALRHRGRVPLGPLPAPLRAPACWASSPRRRRRTSDLALRRWPSSCSPSSPTSVAAADEGSRLPELPTPHERLRELGLKLPAPPAALASYVPSRLVPIGDGRALLFVAGQV